MFKKCIATYVSLLMVLIPFSASLAAQGNKIPVLNEQKLIEKLREIAPFELPVLNNNQAQDAQFVQRSALELLALLESNDGAFTLILEQAKGIKPVDEMKQLIKDNLIRLAAINDPVAPGCLTPWTFSQLELWAIAPVSFIYFIDYMIYFPEDADCVLMYADFWLASVFTGLAIQQTYYICAENTKASPDPAVIAGYESDRTTMRILAAVFYGFCIYNVSNCSDLLFGIWGNDVDNND
jgi:hypothetical protein